MHGLRPLLLLVPLLLLSGPALAQTDDELAKEYYDLGEKLYNRSDYEGALKQFELAYRHSKRPALYYNMARCYEFLGKLEQAIQHYEKFLESEPKQAPQVRIRIENLKKRLEASKPEPVKPVEPAKPEPVEPVKPEPVKPVEPEPVEPGPPQRSRWMRTTGWVAVGLGGAALVTSVVLGVMAAEKSSAVEDAAGGADPKAWSEVEGDYDAGQAMEMGQIVSLAVGAAAVVGGALLVFLDHRAEKRQHQAWVAPGVTPGGGLVTAGFSF